jgi:hypothetical protein
VSDPLREALTEALRPVVAELVEADLGQRLTAIDLARADVEYLTTAEYADRFRTTTGAVLARIHRGTLRAIRPPGSREWLIPVNGQGYDDRQ